MPWSAVPALVERDLVAVAADPAAPVEQVRRAYGDLAAIAYDDLLGALREAQRDTRLGELALGLMTAEDVDTFLARWRPLTVMSRDMGLI